MTRALLTLAVMLVWAMPAFAHHEPGDPIHNHSLLPLIGVMAFISLVTFAAYRLMVGQDAE